MEAFKKIFTNKTENKDTLTGDGQCFVDVVIKVDTNGLIIKGFSGDLIPLSDISDVTLESNNILSFFIKNQKFIYESKNEIKILYENLKKVAKDKTIFEAKEVIYYVYNTETKLFDLNGSDVNLKILEKGSDVNPKIFEKDEKQPGNIFFIKIIDCSKLLHYEQIRTKTQYYFDRNSRSFVWSVFNEGSFHTFCIEFRDHLKFLDFCSKYVECCYKSVNDEKNFEYFKNISMYENAEDIKKLSEKNNEINLSVEIADNVKDTSKTQEGEDGYRRWDQHEPYESKKYGFNEDEEVNKKLVMGNNQVFVSRGSSLGVFDVTQDDLVFRTHIKNTLNEPDKIMTFNQDQNLLILDKNSKDQLHLLDLNRGEVIEKWDVGVSLNDYFLKDDPSSSTPSNLVGLSDYSLLRIDPRSKDKVVQQNKYKAKNEFSCGLSTRKGDVAVASKKGDLRLYDKIDKRAKSLLPGFGDEVLGIDSSSDGSLILCTCENYILLYTVGTDYSKPLGKDKPTPKRLQLKPQHLSLIKNDVSFTSAKFDSNDSLIITSTGRFVVKWLVKDVLEGKIYNYSLKALHDIVVDENFVMNGSDIVVALPNDVKKVSEKDLKNPN